MNMLRIGNRNDALYLLQANHQAVKEQISSGIKTIEQAAILDVVALGYVAYGDQEILDNLLRMVFFTFRTSVILLFILHSPETNKILPAIFSLDKNAMQNLIITVFLHIIFFTCVWLMTVVWNRG